MNEIIGQLKQRKSVRVYEEREIEQHIKKEILNAAFEAPTAGAMMLYTILDITDQQLKERLAILCDNQPFIAKAPMVLIFLADYQRWYDTFDVAECNPRTPEEGDMLLAYADAVIAAQNTVVAAESFGIGSCYIGDILENYEEVKKVLELPDYVIPAAMLVYGYPTQSQKERKKPERFDEKFIVHENKYKRMSKNELEEMYHLRREKSGLEHQDFEEYTKKFCDRKYMSEFSKEMSRSAREYLKNFKK